MNDLRRRIIFRADGNNEMGLGHLVRSSALASALNEDYDCRLATRCTISQVLKEAAPFFTHILHLSERDYYAEAESFPEIATSAEDLIVLDGYFFDSKYQQLLHRGGYDFFSIDDIHATQFLSSVIINHSGGIGPLDYKARPGTQFYLGPRYSLLRNIFLETAEKRRTVINNKDCFICFGGADPQNKTLEIVSDDKLLKYFDHVHVVTGGAYKHQLELSKIAEKNKDISLYSSLSGKELVSLMQTCSFAICSPSTVMYEYMCTGGVVFLEQIADNQKDVIKYMTGEGFAFLLTDIGRVEPSKFQSALNKQSQYFDGRSGERFRKLFNQHFYASKMVIRRAKKDDLQTCYEWANDKAVRLQSYHREPISLEEHIGWFNKKLVDPNSFFYIIEIEKKPIAQIRFQVINNEAVLGYLADESIRNRGLGTSILSKGIERFVCEFRKSIYIVGYVKYSNLSSQRSFERLAFAKSESKEYPESFKYTMYYDD